MNRTWTLKTLFILAAVALVLVVAPLLKAGEYHNVGTLQCYECHVMHGSQAHGYAADGTGAFTAITSGGPWENLLRANENDLCLTCHNANSVAPDVLADNTGKYSTEKREAGALNDNGSTATYEAGNGHSLGFPSAGLIPGIGTSGWKPNATDGFRCIDCHEEHGNTNHRNIHLKPGGIATAVTVDYKIDGAATAGNDLTKVLYYKDAVTATANTYNQDEIFFNEPTARPSALADWCKGCHTIFHGAVGDATTIGGTAIGGTTGIDFKRHPSTGAVEIGAGDTSHSDQTHFGAATNRLKVTSPSGDWGGWDTGNIVDLDLSVTCLTCHKAHGNQNAFGLIYMSDTGTVTEEGDGGTITQMCQQCHINGTTARTLAAAP